MAITPFYRTIPPDKVESTHKEKLARLVQLKKTMRDVLMDSAASLDMIPSGEQVVLGVTIFNHNWENTEGIPGQVIMRARRQTLLDLKTGRGDRAKLEAAIYTQEF